MRLPTLWLLLMAASPLLAGGTIEGTVSPHGGDAGEARVPLRYVGETAVKQEDEDAPPSPAVVFLDDGKSEFILPKDPPKMVQKGLAFLPRVLPVLVGSTVEFPNEDDIQHNIFSYSAAKRFDLGRYRTGESRSVTFDKPGLVRVYCEIHSNMKGFILVLENPFYALVGEDGAYKIACVPAGRHKLTIWQEEHSPVVIEVDLPDGATVKQDATLTSASQPPARSDDGHACCGPADSDGSAPSPAMSFEPLPGAQR